MDYMKEYYLNVCKLLENLCENRNLYERAAKTLAETISNEKLIHIIGTEIHSSIAAEEIFFRQGSLANVNPMFDPSFSASHYASRALYLKETDLCGEFIMDYYRNINNGDVIILIDNDGVGNACYEVVKKSKEKGLFIIAITSAKFSNAVEPECQFRNNEKVNLCDIKEIDIIIDNKVPAFDTTVDFPGIGRSAGWISTIANSFILNSILLLTLKIIEANDIKADVWDNFYSIQGLLNNENLIEKYYDKIKHI
jgi:uncharacterized phosphosugar-binding protein